MLGFARPPFIKEKHGWKEEMSNDEKERGNVKREGQGTEKEQRGEKEQLKTSCRFSQWLPSVDQNSQVFNYNL